MVEAVVAVIATAVGGVLALAGDLVRRRVTRGDRWLEELHRAASEVVGSYGRVRNALILARRGGGPHSREALEYAERSLMVARLMSLPGAEQLADGLERVSTSTWDLIEATGTGAAEDRWEACATAQRQAIREFEEAVRGLLR